MFFKKVILTCLLVASLGVQAAETAVTKNIRFEDTHGKVFHLDDFKGNWLVLNYWATWCSTCLSKMPTFGRFSETLDETNFKVILLNLEAEPVDQFIEMKVRPKTGKSLIAFGYEEESSYIETITAVPTTYLINPEGKIVEKAIGDLDFDKLSAWRAQSVVSDGQSISAN